MKIFKLLILLLHVFLILSAELKINSKRKHRTKSEFKNHFNKNHTKTCPGGWKYFLGGILYNGAVDVMQSSGIFGNSNIEQCVDNILNTLWNLMKEYKKIEQKEKEEGNTYKSCIDSACSVIKFCSKVALTGMTCYLTGGIINPVVIGMMTNFAVDSVTEDLDAFWKNKAIPFLEIVMKFFTMVNFSDILSTLYACFGKEKIWGFFTQMGVQLLEYYSDSPLVQIGEVVLSGVDTALKAYETASEHPIVGPAMEIASLLGPGGVAVKGAKVALRSGIGKTALKTGAKYMTRKGTVKGMWKLGKGIMKNIVKIGSKLATIVNIMGSEIGNLIFNFGRDIINLTSETDDCKRWGLWGKIIYKGFRLAKIIYFGPGTSSVSTNESTPISDEEQIWNLAMDSDPFLNGIK